MKKVTTIGKVANGNVFIWKNKELIDNIKSFGDCNFILTVEVQHDKRSSPQNRYYWGVVIPAFCQGASEMTGDIWSKESAHSTLKNRFLFSEIVNENTGEILTVIGSTSDLTTVQFNEYIDRCRDFIQEWFGCYVPAPNEITD